MKYLATLAISGVFCIGLTAPVTAERAGVYDRIEDRIDRRESVLDRRVNNGRRDRIEDGVDRRESIRDRANLPTSRAVNRWERRSWRNRWGR